MARTTKPLTDTEAKLAKPKAKEYNLADGSGLYLRVKPNGTKLWLFNYTHLYTGKRVNIGLGQYPALSLTKARQKRQENLELLAQEIDPVTHRKDQRRLKSEAHGHTLNVIARSWFQIKKSQVSQPYAEDIFRSLDLHILPSLGDMPVHLLRARDVIAKLAPIAARGSLETVKRICQRLNEIMIYAVNTDLVASNPLSGIGKAFESPEKKNMPTLKPDELPALMHTIDGASIKLTTRCLIEWQLHTMVRPSEAAGATWDEIDFKKEVWTIPAERMKKRRAHVVPLSSQALVLLDIMKPISGHREHIFPAERKPRKHINEQTANMALKRMGYGDRLVAHGMRSLASTTLNEQGFDADVIESALAHSDKNEVRAAYNRAEYISRRKVMMQWWSDHIERAAIGNVSLTGKKQLRAVG